ncbi:MAG: hypothetical protein WDA42_07135 [Candidatus Bathyarchaeia archaeon]
MSKKDADATINATSESKEMVPAGESNLQQFGITPQPVTLTKQQAEAATGIKGKQFFPFLSLVQKTSKVIEDGVKPGAWVFKRNNKDANYVDLEATFPAFILGIRGKALYWDRNNETMQTEYCIARGKEKEDIYKTPQYDVFVQKALEGGAGTYFENPYRQGLEVLLWLPHPDVNAFVVYFANSPKQISAVEEQIIPYVGYAVLWTSARQENKRGVFYTPDCTPMDEEDAGALQNVPTPEMYKEAMNLFTNPPRFPAAGNDDLASAEKAEDSKIER